MPNEYNLNALTEQRRLQNLGVLPNAIGYRELLPYIQETNKSMGDTPIGSSKYDTIQSLSDIENIENIRASNQSSALKLLNGLGKMTTTAATTFVSNTLGSLYGLGKGLYNLVDGDEHTGFRDGLWNNSIVSAMQSIQDKMESVLPNYYSTAERENPWYSNIFTANFWGDKFLKNAGFTIGAMATMAVPGFKNFFGIGKGIANIGKAFANTTKGLQMAEKAGKIAMRVGNTLVSAAGEANIEAYNGAKAFMDTQENNINRAYNEAVQNINDEFDQNIANGMGYAQAKQIYDQKINNIENEKRDLLTHAKQHATDVGNSIFTLNMGILSASNNIQFSRLLSGGWNSSKRLMQKEGVKLLINGKETSDFKAWGKALAKGNASLEGATKSYGKNMLLGTTENMLSEGSEELLQNLASGTSQAVHSAEVNQYIKQRTANENPYSLYAKSINPEVTDELVSWTKALGKVWQDEFGKASAGGWEEFVLGALTGGLGTVSVRKKDSGKVGLSWQGGFYEAYKDIKEENAENELRAELIKSYINNPKFKENTLHAVAAMSIAEDMDKALINNDVLLYRNLEMMSLANDANYFRNKGMIDAYKGYFEEISNGISDTDVENIRTLTSTINKNNPNVSSSFSSYYAEKSKDEIKKLFRDKAQSNLNKVTSYLDTLDNIYVKYEDAFNKVADGDPFIVDELVKEAAADQSLIDDMKNRRNNPNLTEKEKEEIDKEIEKVQLDLNKVLNNPEEKIEEYKEIEKRAENIRNGKDREKTIDSYRKANTIQDVANVYYFTDPYNRTNWFNQSLKTAEGSNKELLKKFEKFAAQAGYLNTAVSDYIKKYPGISRNKELSDALITNAGDILDSILYDIANDENTKYTTESLPDALRDFVKNNKEDVKKVRFLEDLLNYVATELDNIEDLVKQNDKIRSRTQSQNGSSSTSGGKNKGRGSSNDNTPANNDSTSSNGDDKGVINVGNDSRDNVVGSSSNNNGNSGSNYNSSSNGGNDNGENNNGGNNSAGSNNNSNNGNNNIDNNDNSSNDDNHVSSNVDKFIIGIDPEYSIKGKLRKERRAVDYLKQIRPGADLDYMSNVILGMVYKNNNNSIDKVPVYFVKIHDVNTKNGKFNSRIYTAIDASEIPKAYRNSFKVQACTFGDKVIIGCFYANNAKKHKLIEEQYDIITEDINKQQATGSIYISSYTSYIKEVFSGNMPDSVQSYDLAELLNDKSANPFGINVSNMMFRVTYEGPQDRYVNIPNGEKLEPIGNQAEPGTVLLYLRTVKNTIVPVLKILPTFFNDSTIKKDSKYWKKIEYAIDRVVNAKTIEERKVEVAKLIGGDGSLLVPSDAKNQKAFYSDDKNNQNLYNHLIIRTANTRLDIDFNTFNTETAEGKEQARQALLNGLEELNPGISLNTNDLEQEEVRKELLNAGILRVNSPILYFKNVIPYIQPLGSNGKPVEVTKSTTSISPVLSGRQATTEACRINNIEYKKNGNTWYDGKGKEIKNQLEIQKLNDLYFIIKNPKDSEYYIEESIYKSPSGTLYKETNNHVYEEVINEKEKNRITKKVEEKAKRKQAISNLDTVLDDINNLYKDNTTTEQNKSMQTDQNQDMSNESLILSQINSLNDNTTIENGTQNYPTSTSSPDSENKKYSNPPRRFGSFSKKHSYNVSNTKNNSIFANENNKKIIVEKLKEKGYKEEEIKSNDQIIKILNNDPSTKEALANIKSQNDTENIERLIDNIKCINR